ncbi:MAG TPA: hypothetical protein VEZ40_08945 [Pyrinomonadaceae bacterium]|nr:hypothetical protein [Pyrinomonadaceae bacterium]
MSSAILDQLAHEPSKPLAPYTVAAETCLETEMQTPAEEILSAPLIALVENLKPASLSATMRRVFTDLARLLDYLRLIEKKVQQDQLLASTSSVFTNLHKESLALIEQIDADMLNLEGMSEELLSTLDGISYAIGHEIGRVYGFELVGINDPQAPPIRAKLERAHGLLRNCFQQSTIALTQVFNPALGGEELFNDFQARREEALVLYRDLWNLVGLARRADRECDQFSVALLLAHLKRFRDGSMCYLMYRDWEEYERFVKQVMGARRILEIGPALEGLTCYLETLLGQVRLRSVLTNLSFIVPDTDENQSAH